MIHLPVLAEEAVSLLNLKECGVYADATLGAGGHALKIMEKTNGKARLIGLDLDDEITKSAADRLKQYKERVTIIKQNFADVDLALQKAGVGKLDGILFDLGVSSLELDSKERGFSFQHDAPLDMRMDVTSAVTAADLVNTLTQAELQKILSEFGEEMFSGRIARQIVEAREKQKINTTKELSEIIFNAVPGKFRHGRIHPSTRTFQALRIAVNKELDNLRIALTKLPELLNPAGRIVVISFHSLEDRIVKWFFKENSKEGGLLRVITKKPITPSDEEIQSNPRSRSAKLRAAERI